MLQRVAACFIVVLFVSDEFFVCVGYRSWGVCLLQRVAVCCSVLPYAAACCSVLQRLLLWFFDE